MSFINPYGLWFLLGIPILIILYILKQKYADRAVSSSFIWRKSEHLIKKNIRWRRLLRYILFMLQLMVVALTSFMIARPVINQDDTGIEYYVIIDGSASMLAISDGESRFDRVLDGISDMAEDMPYGSKMTIILAADSALCVVNGSDSEAVINKGLNSLECGLSDADIDSAIALAESESADAGNAVIMVYTDKDYEQIGDVIIVNMSCGEWNAALINLTAEDGDDGTVFTSTVASYGADATLTLALYVDGAFVDAQYAQCLSGVPVDVSWDSLDLVSYDQAEVSFEADDSISIDNRYVICSDDDAAKEVLIVSQYPYFLRNVLASNGDYNITTAQSPDAIPAGEDDESADTLSGYDLYIFDGVMPDTLPDDGAIWLINPDDSLGETGLELGDAAEGSALTASGNDSSETYAALTQYLDADDIVVSEFTRLLSYGDYETILACGDSPVLLAKEDDHYIRTLALMFDIHDSNLPLLIDFPLLIHNMLDFSLPSMLDSRDYTAGEAVYISALTNCSAISVENEEGKDYEVALTSSTGIFTPDETGVFGVKQIMAGGSSVSVAEDAFFIHISASESNIYAEGGSLGFEAEAEEASGDGDDGFLSRLLSGEMKLWPYLAMLLLIILLTEWWLYYREEF